MEHVVPCSFILKSTCALFYYEFVVFPFVYNSLTGRQVMLFIVFLVRFSNYLPWNMVTFILMRFLAQYPLVCHLNQK